MSFDWKTLTFNMEGVELKDFSTIPDQLSEIIRHPQNHLLEALLLLAIVVVFIIVIALTVISFVTRPKKPVLIETYLVDTDELNADGTTKQVLVEKEIEIPKNKARKYYVVATFILMVAVMWIVTGITTQNDRVCESCHVNSEHVKEMAGDVHSDARCVQCHEDYGTMGSVTLSVPTRISHIVVGTFRTTNVPGYKAYPDNSCNHCHGDIKNKGIVVDADNGIRMSHKEPVDAGMRCTQCHILDESGKVGSQTAGMQSCLKCHNGQQASASCDDCHRKTPTVVARTKASPDNAQPLVSPTYAANSCYDCHNPAPCDSCHGVRMPHPAGYAGGGIEHANDAKKYGYSTCYKCHTPGTAAGQGAATEGNTGGGLAGPCETCHTINPDGSIG